MTEATTTLEPCTAADINLDLTVNEDVSEADRPEAEEARERCLVVLDEYLSHFAKPIRSDGEPGLITGSLKCVCGKPLNGFLGTFRWGIVHGEGACTSCGHPARGAHYVDLGEDGELTIPIVLLYLPAEKEGAA